MTRFERQERLFGKDGQEKLRGTHVSLTGAGGVGGFVVMELALLGVGEITVIDDEELDVTNKNRYPTSRHDDPVPGTSKVDIAARLINLYDPTIRVHKIPLSLLTTDGLRGVIAADVAIGSVDSEGARFVLNELCSAYEKPYIDISSDIILGNPPAYGGTVVSNWNGEGCLICRGQLDVHEAQEELAGEQGRKLRDAIYGINRHSLGNVGPSVVTINGLVASLAVTEFMVAVTGVRAAQPVLTYHGRSGKVTANTDPPHKDCYYCKAVRGTRERANIFKYSKVIQAAESNRNVSRLIGTRPDSQSSRLEREGD